MPTRPSAVQPPVRLIASGLARGGGLFLGLFVLVGVVGELRGRQTNVELWFVDIRDLADVVRIVLLATFGGLIVAWALSPSPPRRLAQWTAGSCLVIAAFAVRDAIRFVGRAAEPPVRAAMPVPLSAVVAVLLLGLAIAAARSGSATGAQTDRPRHRNRRSWAPVAAAAVGWAIVFPIAQMAFFGTTNYERPADAAVVFGARVYADGSPSPLLADRLATAIELYRDGLIPTVVVSGGAGADGWNEAEVMDAVAVAGGVAPVDVVIDRAGVTTEATVANTMAWLSERFGPSNASGVRLIAVSQAYHLPRIQLAFAAAGLDVLTVPARDAVPISEMPLLVAREIPAFWTYYVRQCLL